MECFLDNRTGLPTYRTASASRARRRLGFGAHAELGLGP